MGLLRTDLALVTHALYYIHACALLARLRFASQDGKKNNEAKIITQVPQEARVIIVKSMLAYCKLTVCQYPKEGLINSFTHNPMTYCLY